MFEQKLPAQSQLPETVKGPWTPEARQRALDREVLAHYSEYAGRALKFRNWSPWHNLPLEEIGQWGPRLSQETAHLIEGFLGVEEYVGDYVLEGLEMFRHDRTRRNLQLQWGAEETRHGVAWELVLKHSRARTEQQLQTYLAKVRECRWSVKQHPGIDSPLGSSAYAMVQERATYFNYQEMRARIREEYGLPLTPTAEEQRRGYEVGASEVFRLVGLDEIAHHGVFLNIVQSHIKYFPSLTFDVLARVFQGFEMPSLRFIPNARAFLRAVRRTDFYSGDIHREKVHNPVLKSLGLAGQEAFEKAVQLARKLPADLGPDSVTLSRTGEWVSAYSQTSAAS
ncbi:MAG TPA: acyl-ACP desaturase [Candidatus Binatia bacterium]|nr:acyl-ACP desaturase [Candidatus Binatia bacterium]